MFVLLLLHYLSLNQRAAQAHPAILPINIALAPSLIQRLDPGSANEAENRNKKSIWNIVWSCATTLFACTWVSIHPNIPNPKHSDWKLLLRRLKWMLLVILIPEVTIYRAFFEFYCAKKVAEKYNQLRNSGQVVAQVARTCEKPEECWTRTHGFFVIMGGFMLCTSDGKPLWPLRLTQLFIYAKKGGIEWSQITEKETHDRSKGDYLTKGIVVLQTTWFIATCIARAVQHLAITELEIVTLAFAALNGLVYFFWWKKPLDIRCPIHVYLTPSEKPPPVTPDLTTTLISQINRWLYFLQPFADEEIDGQALDAQLQLDDGDNGAMQAQTSFAPTGQRELKKSGASWRCGGL